MTPESTVNPRYNRRQVLEPAKQQPLEKGVMARRNGNAIYVERSGKGGFKNSWRGSSRPIGNYDSQREAIAAPRTRDPEAVHAARVRITSLGHPDQFRKT
jgi:hypothetical protein